MGDFARFQFNEEKGNEWSKAEIGDLEAHRRPTYQQRDYGERSPTSAQMARGRRTCRMYFWIVRLHTRIPSLSNSPRMRSAQKTPIVPCHLLDQCDRLWRELRLSRISLGLALPEQAEEFSMPPKHYLQLRNEERLLPGPHHPRQKHQQEPIGLPASRLFDVSTQDDELLP